MTPKTNVEIELCAKLHWMEHKIRNLKEQAEEILNDNETYEGDYENFIANILDL